MSEPVWTQHEIDRLLGCCDGYIHAIVTLKMTIGHMTYRPIDKRHVRKIAQREIAVKPLREMLEKFDRDLRRCQEAYRLQSE